MINLIWYRRIIIHIIKEQAFEIKRKTQAQGTQNSAQVLSQTGLIRTGSSRTSLVFKCLFEHSTQFQTVVKLRCQTCQLMLQLIAIPKYEMEINNPKLKHHILKNIYNDITLPC